MKFNSGDYHPVVFNNKGRALVRVSVSEAGKPTFHTHGKSYSPDQILWVGTALNINWGGE